MEWIFFAFKSHLGLIPMLSSLCLYYCVFRRNQTLDAGRINFGKGSKQYKEFVSVVENSKAFESWLKDKTGLENTSAVRMKYAHMQSIIESRESVAPIDSAQAQNELIADFVGDMLFTDDGSKLEGLLADVDSKQHNAVVRFVLDFISYLKKKLQGNKQLTFELSRLEDSFNRMLLDVKENTTDDGGVKYSIGYTTDNKPVAIIDNDILDGVPKSRWIQTVKDTISEKFSNGIPISGRLIKVNSISRSEFTNSKYSKYLKSSDGTIYQDKFKSANNLDDIVLASTNYINEDLKHSRKDKFTEFARGDVLIRVGENNYSAKVIVGFTSGKQMVLYDVINFTPTSLDIKNKDSSIDFGTGRNLRNELSFDSTVSQSEQSVNNQSMQGGENNATEYSVPFDRKKKTSYNEFNTLAMQWAYSAGTEPGDLKILNRKGKEFVLLKATDDGYVELAAGKYEEMKYIGQQYYNEPDNSVHVHSQVFKSSKARSAKNNDITENNSKHGYGSKKIGSEGLQNDPTGNAENLRSSDRRESDTGAGLDKSAFSIPQNKYSISDESADLFDRYDKGEISREEFSEKLREKWDRAGEEYGTVPKGEKAVDDYKVPKSVGDGKLTHRHTRTILETGALTKEMEYELGAKILIGDFAYTPIF